MNVICNETNVLMKGRFKTVYQKIAGSDDVIEVEEFQVKTLVKGSRWLPANRDDYRAINTKTVLCTFVDHNMPCKKAL